MVQIPVEVIGPPGPLQALRLAGDAVILGVGQGVERLGEAVPPLAQGPALGGDGEIHPQGGPPVTHFRQKREKNFRKYFC